MTTNQQIIDTDSLISREEASAIARETHPEYLRKAAAVERRRNARIEAAERICRAQIEGLIRKFEADKKQATDEAAEELRRIKHDMLHALVDRHKRGLDEGSEEFRARKLRRREGSVSASNASAADTQGPDEYMGEKEVRLAKKKEQIANVVFELSQEDIDADVTLFRSYGLAGSR
jgi:hypothetical protein